MGKNIDNVLEKAIAARNLLAEDQVETVKKEAARAGQSLSSILIKQKLFTEDQLLDVLSQELNLPHVILRNITVERSVVERIPLKVATYYKFMPIKIDGGTLTIAVSYPLDIKIQDEIRTHLGYHIEMVLAGDAEIHDVLTAHYGLAADTIHKIISKEPKRHGPESHAGEASIEDVEKLVEDESVVKLVNQIISEAYKRRATDIHIEPYRGKVRLRYRIDGVLHHAPVPPEIIHFYGAILSRMKIMANLNIIERRLPQDGRAIVKVHDQILDLRISSVPTPYAESLVIRLLPTTMLFSLEKLGLSQKDLTIFQELVKKPHGIIFVTGPTGSGKTTTLYTCLSSINTDTRKIITIEDPIEYEMDGITQLQVMPDVGLSFAAALRSVLRHDPDVIMVGEVRDLETAEIAIRVALTGHLVFSTLHTNDAASGILRLIDIGIEPYLLASSVEAFIAQRLLRIICPHCKAEDTSRGEEIRHQIIHDLGLSPDTEIKFYKGRGCKECNATGFFGRTAIYEILQMDNVIKNMVLRHASSDEMKAVAMKRGMRTLRQDGWKKVMDGVTTPEEVLELTQKDQSNHVNDAPRPLSPAAATTEAQQPSKAGRRVYARLSTKVNLTYGVVEPREITSQKFPTEYFSVTNDISAGGLALVDRGHHPLGTILELKIDLPDAKGPITCLGRVMRVEELEFNKAYMMAVCFLDLPSAQRVRLNRYIEEELE